MNLSWLFMSSLDTPSMIALCQDNWIVVNPEYPIDVITRKLRYIYLNEIDKTFFNNKWSNIYKQNFRFF